MHLGIFRLKGSVESVSCNASIISPEGNDAHSRSRVFIATTGFERKPVGFVALRR